MTKILAIDDKQDNLISISALLKNLLPECEVITAQSGFEGIETALIDPPDTILMDIEMPLMNGYETAKRLKSHSQLQTIPIIMLTAAKSDNESHIKGLESGADAFLSKPIDPYVLIAHVNAALRLRKAEKELRASEKKYRSLFIKMKEKESYLRAIMETVRTGIVLIDPETCRIVNVNPFAAEMIGEQPEELIGRNCHNYICFDRAEKCPMPTLCREQHQHVDRMLRTVNGESVDVRISYSTLKLKDKPYFLQNLSDITDIKNLLKKMEISIDLAKNILALANNIPSRYTELKSNRVLFFDAISVPCCIEGGDHYFLRNFSDTFKDENKKTVLSLKDQSGHQVGCILRSIIADLMHHSILSGGRPQTLESVMTTLNSEICRSRFFRDDDFFTAMVVEIDHDTLMLRYVSAGHPPFLLIRGKAIKSFPKTDGAGMNVPMATLPDITFSTGELQLQEGDKLIFYTDGLVEMPLKNRRRIIKTPELKRLVAEILQHNPEMAVSAIMEKMLTSVSIISDETIIPASHDTPPKNTSDDDITILGLEIENQAHSHTMVLKPRNNDDLYEFINTLCLKFTRQLHQRGFESPEERIRMILGEVLLNAWCHGNQCDPEKSITVKWRLENDFHLMVSDEGKGFDYTRIPEPTADENLTRECGRGLFIIRYFADAVNWKDGGRQLNVYLGKRPNTRQSLTQVPVGSFMDLWDLANISDDIDIE